MSAGSAACRGTSGFTRCHGYTYRGRQDTEDQKKGYDGIRDERAAAPTGWRGGSTKIATSRSAEKMERPRPLPRTASTDPAAAAGERSGFSRFTSLSPLSQKCIVEASESSCLQVAQIHPERVTQCPTFSRSPGVSSSFTPVPSPPVPPPAAVSRCRLRER